MSMKKIIDVLGIIAFDVLRISVITIPLSLVFCSFGLISIEVAAAFFGVVWCLTLACTCAYVMMELIFGNN